MSLQNKMNDLHIQTHVYMYVEYPNFLFQSIKLSQIGNNATNCGVKNFNRFHVLITLISRRMKNGDGEWIDISALRLLLFYFIFY